MDCVFVLLFLIMKCAYCQSLTRVLETRKHATADVKDELLRKRECLQNGHRFYTVEKVIGLKCNDREQVADTRSAEKSLQNSGSSL